MSKFTLDEAIKHCLEVAEKNEISAITYKSCKEIKTNMYEKLTAEKAENDCRECATEHRQLAEWFKELKELREENKEAKRLLKSAINVLKIYRPCDDDICSECINHTRCYEDNYFEWKYLNTPELKKIIGE